MSFYFYDLETTGFDPRYGQVVQFGGQRTNEQLEPVDEPYEALIKLSEDVLPSPEAAMVTGITPQKTIEEGYTEAEFLHHFNGQVRKLGTIVVGYNTIRFDDEFMRNMLYRNFHDPYEWQWKDRNSRWDLLDVGRMMRALRPEGVNWPEDDGKPTNRLEALTAANGIEHGNAHDALADVNATMELAKLFNKAQPKLFEYLLKMRSKKEVAKLIDPDKPQPFVYTSGRFESEFAKTTIAFPIAVHPYIPGQILVYDLRRDPSEIVDMTVEDMIANLTTPYKKRGKDFKKLPIKVLATNKCPAVAPLSVMDEASWGRIGLDVATVRRHLSLLEEHNIIAKKALDTWDEYGKPREFDDDVDAQLYAGFFNDKDRALAVDVRKKSVDELADYHPDFIDERLPELLLRYKAKNYPDSLSEEEKKIWQKHVAERLENGAGGSPSLKAYFESIRKFISTHQDKESQFLLEELKLYGESLIEDSDT